MNAPAQKVDPKVFVERIRGNDPYAAAVIDRLLMKVHTLRTAMWRVSVSGTGAAVDDFYKVLEDRS